METKDDFIYWILYDYLKGEKDKLDFPEYNFEKFIKEYNISETEETTMSGFKKDWLVFLVLVSTRYWNSDPNIEDHQEDPPTGDDIIDEISMGD